MTLKAVGVVVFVGCTSGKGEDGFVKEFHKGRPGDSSIFEILMERLAEIADQYGCPQTYLFHRAGDLTKVSDFLKSYRYADSVQLCLQDTHPILNLNGNLCLRSSDSPDVVELPCGSGDFHTASVQGENILERMKREGVQFVCCFECENLMEMVVDPFLVGLLAESRHELAYKCAYPADQREKSFRRMVLQNGVPRADTLLTLNSFINYNHKYRSKNNENFLNSPLWTNSLVFRLAPVAAVLQGPNRPPTFPHAVNYTMRNMSYWSPIDSQMRSQ
jgi:hypothetical protein